jgi:hypothetical protein
MCGPGIWMLRIVENSGRIADSGVRIDPYMYGSALRCSVEARNRRREARMKDK